MSLGHAAMWRVIGDIQMFAIHPDSSAAVRWIVKSASVTIPGPVSDREIGQAKNILRKASKGFDHIFRDKGL